MLGPEPMEIILLQLEGRLLLMVLVIKFMNHSDANFYHLTISNTGGDVEADTDIDVNVI